MNWTKPFKRVAVMSVLLLVSALGACSEATSTVSPQDIIENVVKENKQPFSYYAESTTTSNDGIAFTMKEWRDESGKSRNEAIDDLGNSSYSVNDGSTVWSYNNETKEVLMIGLENEDLETINRSPSEQAKLLLELVENTHTVEVIGDETFINRDVIHVKATPNKQEGNLYGEQELWIDKETWFILKSTSIVDDTTVTTEYTIFEINPKFADDLFVFEIPEGAEVVDLSDFGEQIILHDVNEAVEYLDQPFYYVEEQNDLLLNDIEVFSMEGIPTQLTFNYVKNSIPYFSLVVTPVEDENKPYNGSDGLNVRGQEATLDEFGGFRSISWVQDGIGYALLISTADVTTEEVLMLMEKVKMS